MKYKVTLTYKYTHTVEVEADSKSDAEDLAIQECDESNRNHDDWLYDSVASEVEE